MLQRLWLSPLVLLLTAQVWAAEPLPLQPQLSGATDQIIVKLRPTAQRSMMFSAETQVEAAIANVGLGIPANYERAMGDNAHVVQLPGIMTLQEAQDYATLLRTNPDVEYAEPDQLMFPTSSLMPNDPQFLSQWHYNAASADGGAANLPAAWGEVTNAPDIVVAVVDTGAVDHPDLSANLLGGQAARSGYDFVNMAARGNDGDGRDSNPSDPGDWISAMDATDSVFLGCTVRNSSWHGTHVAGTIGAVSNNGVGVAGVAWNAKILVARGMGKCGGYLSDISDAIRWSSGETVNGVPNPNPAKVINLSLGGNGSCGITYQSAIDAANARGATVVVAAGNSNRDVSAHRPANCNNVIAVTALARTGGKASFGNTGAGVDIAAPGVSVLSTVNGGKTAPTDQHLYASYHGTSMATPHVSGVIALMLAANPHLRDGSIPAGEIPALLKRKLKASARPFVSGTGNDCNTTLCGAGALDAYQAVMSVKTPPSAQAGTNQSVSMGAGVTLRGTANAGGYGGSIRQYHWQQTAGTPVTLSNNSVASPTFVAPATAGTLAFRLTVTNDVGLTATSVTNVTVGVAPTSTSTCEPVVLNNAQTLTGQWAAGCTSQHRGRGFFARYYRFTLATVSTVKFDLKSSRQDPYLYLLAGDQTTSSVLTFNDDSNGTTDSQIVRHLPAGTYLLEATTYSAGRAGEFTISAAVATAPVTQNNCQPTVLVLGATTNGQWETCTARKRGSTHYARHYHFTLPQTATVTIDLKSGQQDTYLYLLNGSSVDSSVLTFNDDSNGTLNSQIKRTLAAGTYTLEATTYYRQKTGAFSVTVK
ncbi:S8 family peptidase [Candidatus Thiothrix anitrata]|uniref:S8 family serine peptidase n=1 Tax=Candidatus Thiothrix anitrata TaxID=2823902 RepID=A0ABX7X2G0_9GAMM|nr:S8 family peptidase [Candidatus Thiothrix anitrata]QTR50074.1 S8 family serine peptidase [Candidatus Thiothrix anitrata]